MGSTANEITMFIDTSKCIGCRACQVACKQWHSLPAETDEGIVTGVTSNTLVDSTRIPTTPPTPTNPLSWAINQWAGRGVQILAGTGAGQKRTITSNTADTLTVSPIWSSALDGTSEYALSTTFTGAYTNPPDMSGNNLTVVKFKESEGLEGLKFLFLKDQCRHCYQPKCKRGCPGGVYQTNEGFVLFSSNCNDANVKPRKIKNPAFNPGLPVSPTNPRTITMTFAEHCPYNIPRLSTKLNQYVKCDFCYDRFARSDLKLQKDKTSMSITTTRTTACEHACPAGAIVTGSLADLMATTHYVGSTKVEGYAKRRYRVVKRDYPFARLYTGYKGRTNVIYLLTETPDKYGLPT